MAAEMAAWRMEIVRLGRERRGWHKGSDEASTELDLKI